MNLKIDPPKNSKSRPGTPSQADEPQTTKLHKHPSGKLVPMNFYVPVDFKREYKIYAAQKDMNMVDVLKSSFELYKKHNN